MCVCVPVSLAMTVKLEETASLLTEVTNVFNPEEDLKETAKFQSAQAKIQSATKTKQAEMADIIKGALTARERQRDRARDRPGACCPAA
eukprot:COSAG03_NODE_602_length_6755_cov_12.895282_8_plen_89_part_00